MNPKLMKILSAFIFLFSLLFFIFIVYADTTIKPKYSTMVNHPDLVKESIEYYQKNGNYFTVTYINLDQLKAGSIHEDYEDYGLLNGLWNRNRYFRHYFDYLHQNDNGGGYRYGTKICYKPGEVLPTYCTSAKIWAFATEEQSLWPSGSHTWPRAVNKYKNAKSDDEKNDAFYDLGHILHLIADMTVPAHTRNDGHVTDTEDYAKTETLNSPHLTKYVPYDYETWCKLYGKYYINNVHLLTGTEPLKIDSKNITDYFDYLSKYTQENFFSYDTIPDPYNPLNNLRAYNYKNTSGELIPKIIFEGEEKFGDDYYYFYYGKDPDDPNKKIHLAYRTIITFLGKRITLNSFSPPSTRHPLINEDYWIRLSKKAMQAIAGVVDLFLTQATVPVDTTPPTQPTGLNVTPVSANQINLTWGASTDDVGVVGYKVNRGTSYLNSVSSTSHSDIGLTPNTQYCYTVIAYDLAGNVSNPTGQVCATTLNPPTVGTLSLSPAGSLSSSGTVGGVFSPTSITYTLSNSGGSLIGWTVSANQPWVTVSKSSGTLGAGGTDTVTVSINSGANSLSAGSYNATVTFTNITNLSGNTTRSVGLTVRSAPSVGTLLVTPAGDLSSLGQKSGPFYPASITYTLTNTNTDGTSINWTASKTQSWVTLSSTGGSLAAGGTSSVTVSINSGASSLDFGNYSDTVTFINTTNNSGTTSRFVGLTVAPVCPVGGPVTFSPPPGTYTTPQSVELSAYSGPPCTATINYSTDGINGKVYTAPIYISTTTTIRADSYLSGEGFIAGPVGETTIGVYTITGVGSTGATGTWVGTYSTSLIPLAHTTLTLTQSGTNVTGTYSTDTGVGGAAGGTYTGTASGDVINWTINQTTPDCPGTFSGTSTVTGNTMNFTFTGTDCTGFHNNGQGTVTRQ